MYNKMNKTNRKYNLRPQKEVILQTFVNDH